MFRVRSIFVCPRPDLVTFLSLVVRDTSGLKPPRFGGCASTRNGVTFVGTVLPLPHGTQIGGERLNIIKAKIWRLTACINGHVHKRRSPASTSKA
ncbi:hypothetical protein HOY80DRAFT_954709 [Tuber brumale]|nr:hypothetical protein HOY80DRAFT_954709 [Tuber brumale]